MYIIFDTETTGLPKRWDAPVTDTSNWPRCVQVAWQLHDDMGRLLEHRDYIVRPEGFNIGFNLGNAVAGGSIAHLHGHIVPRWNGDNNFMPVLGQTRILPQSLDATWQKLNAAALELASSKPRPSSSP